MGRRLILCKAARRLGGADFVEVEVYNRLQCFPAGQARGLKTHGGGVAQRFGQRFEPLRLLAPQSVKFGSRVAPALATAAAIDRPPVADDRSAGMACAITRLALDPRISGRSPGGLRLWPWTPDFVA
jgi:hypothetical protein